MGEGMTRAFLTLPVLIAGTVLLFGPALHARSGAPVALNNPGHDKDHDDDHGDDHGMKGPGASEYGIGTVFVQRGADPASPWAVYSTPLGSPVGDTTSGTFRFTCRTDQAPCHVTVKAAALSGSSGTVLVWPRVLIQRQDYVNAGPTSYCEYGDGVTNSNPFAAIAFQASSPSPALTDLTIGIGGTEDCGYHTPGFVSGDPVTSINVPDGYYDVLSTFVFLKQ